MNKLSLQYAHAGGVSNAKRHIVDPLTPKSSICGQRLDVGDFVVSARLAQGEKLCGNCDRMRSWALELLERKRVSHAAR